MMYVETVSVSGRCQVLRMVGKKPKAPTETSSSIEIVGLSIANQSAKATRADAKNIVLSRVMFQSAWRMLSAAMVREMRLTVRVTQAPAPASPVTCRKKISIVTKPPTDQVYICGLVVPRMVSIIYGP